MNENETHIKDIRIYQAVSKLSHPIDCFLRSRGRDERRSDRSGLSFKLPLQSERNRGRFKRYEEIRS